MRCHRVLPLAAVAALPLLSVAQSPDGALTERLTGQGLSGSVFENIPGGGYRYVSVGASRSLSVKGDEENAQVSAYQSYSDATGWGYRSISCNVPDLALDVKKNSGGGFTATLDSGYSGCWSYGGRYDSVGGQTGTWPFSAEPVTLAVSNPLNTTEGDSHFVSNNRVTGDTYRNNCKSFSGYDASGVMSLGPQTWTLAPPNGLGYFYERACNSKVR